jgi:glycosyltransferase involved in cell wall biosynthesis
MKVGFNARLLASPTLRGWNRYAINLLMQLANLEVELFLYSDQPLATSHLSRLPPDCYQVRIAPPMRYFVWEQFWLPQQCRQDQVEVLHCPFNFGLPWLSPCPRILTLHDAIDQIYYRQQMTWQQRLSFGHLQNQFYHWLARTQAEHIITVSEYSKADLSKYLQIPNHKITVIYEAADARFKQPVSGSERLRVRSLHQLDSAYIFYIGGWEQRKNIPFLIRAFAQANLPQVKLVLAGGKAEQRSPLLSLAADLGIGDRLKLIDWVEDADLPALYAEALCFVYPSEYEGFGLQLCEAMAVGCPVLAARATCLPEILGAGGETFALDQNQLATLLTQLLADSSFRNKLVARAVSRSQCFEWGKAAQQTLNLYARVSCQDD